MSSSWFRRWVSRLTAASRRHRHQTARPRRATPRPRLESLEDRCLLSWSGFQNWLLYTGTPLGEIGDDWAFAVADYIRDGVPDLVGVKKNRTFAGSTEVLILDGASRFQTSLLYAATPLGETGDDWAFAVGDYNGDGAPDLVGVKKNRTGTRSTEVHILSGAVESTCMGDYDQAQAGNYHLYDNVLTFFDGPGGGAVGTDHPLRLDPVFLDAVTSPMPSLTPNTTYTVTASGDGQAGHEVARADPFVESFPEGGSGFLVHRSKHEARGWGGLWGPDLPRTEEASLV